MCTASSQKIKERGQKTLVPAGNTNRIIMESGGTSQRSRKTQASSDMCRNQLCGVLPSLTGPAPRQSPQHRGDHSSIRAYTLPIPLDPFEALQKLLKPLGFPFPGYPPLPPKSISAHPCWLSFIDAHFSGFFFNHNSWSLGPKRICNFALYASQLCIAHLFVYILRPCQENLR